MRQVSKKAKIILAILSTLGLGIIFYFFLMPFDYQVRFSTHNAPWLIYHLIEINHDTIQLIKEEDNQLIFTSNPKNVDDEYYYLWELQRIENRTVAHVKIFFVKNRLKEKVRLIWGESTQVNLIINELKAFTNDLASSSNNYRWEKPVEATLPSANCLCTTIESRIEDKANQMNRNMSLLSTYLPKGKKAPPRLYITNLDLEKQNLQFDFCFPLEKEMNKKIEDQNIFITLKPEIKGEAVAFYGNYSQTHRGWFNYIAMQSAKDTLHLPYVEVFYDSPYGGLEETKWKSKAYFKTVN